MEVRGASYLRKQKDDRDKGRCPAHPLSARYLEPWSHFYTLSELTLLTSGRSVK